MALEKTIDHITSSGFWRLFALVAKRLITIGKTFSKLPFLWTPILYVLHFLRAILRVINYLRKTKNKNLGETRKFFFSVFKVVIAIAAFALCFFMPVPAVLGTAFLLYSILKLVDSSGVLVFSFFAHFKIDKNLPENKWRRDQYWDNIIKHISILAIGVAMTLLTAIVLAGGVAAIVWTSPVIVLSLAIACVVTVVGFLYLGGLFYQRYQSRNNPHLKAECHENLKKFGRLFAVWLLALALVAVPFFISPLAALWLVAGLLTFCNLYDSIKSTYDYFDKTKVIDPEPANLEAKNLLEASTERDYYHNKSYVLYLKTTAESEPKQAIEDNKVWVAKVGLLKIIELHFKLQRLKNEKGFLAYFFSEKSKIETKRNYLLRELAWTLKSHGKDRIDLIHLVMDAIVSLEKDYMELSEKNRPLTVKTKNNIKIIDYLEENLAELLNYIPSQYEKNSGSREKNENNCLITLLEAFEDENLAEVKVKPKRFYQSFWKKEGECETISKFFKTAKNLEQQYMYDTNNNVLRAMG